MINRFESVKFEPQALACFEKFKEQFQELESLVDECSKPGRSRGGVLFKITPSAKSLVLTKLEEAFMWVGKQIGDQQVAETDDQLGGSKE